MYDWISIIPFAQRDGEAVIPRGAGRLSTERASGGDPVGRRSGQDG